MGDIRVAKYRLSRTTYGNFWIAYCKTHRRVLRRTTFFNTVTGGFPSWHSALHAALKHHLEEHPEAYPRSSDEPR